MAVLHSCRDRVGERRRSPLRATLRNRQPGGRLSSLQNDLDVGVRGVIDGCEQRLRGACIPRHRRGRRPQRDGRAGQRLAVQHELPVAPRQLANGKVGEGTRTVEPARVKLDQRKDI